MGFRTDVNSQWLSNGRTGAADHTVPATAAFPSLLAESRINHAVKAALRRFRIGVWLATISLGSHGQAIGYEQPCDLTIFNCEEVIEGSSMLDTNFLQPAIDAMVWAYIEGLGPFGGCNTRYAFTDGLDGGCPTPCAGGVGEPINPATGAMYHDEVDIYCNAGLLPLVVSRRYFSDPIAEQPFRKNAIWFLPEVQENPLTSYHLMPVDDGQGSFRFVYAARPRHIGSADSPEAECLNLPFDPEFVEEIDGWSHSTFHSVDPFFEKLRLGGEGLGQGWGEFFETTVYQPGTLFWLDEAGEEDTWEAFGLANKAALRGDRTFAIRQPAAGYAGKAGWKLLQIDSSKYSSNLVGIDFSDGGAVYGPPIEIAAESDSYCTTKSYSPYDSAEAFTIAPQDYSYVAPNNLRYRFGNRGRLKAIEVLGTAGGVLETLNIEWVFPPGNDWAHNLIRKEVRYSVPGRPYLVFEYGPGLEYQPVLLSATLFGPDDLPVRRVEYEVSGAGGQTARDLRLNSVHYFDYVAQAPGPPLEIPRQSIHYQYDPITKELESRKEFDANQTQVHQIEWTLEADVTTPVSGNDTREAAIYTGSSWKSSDPQNELDRQAWRTFTFNLNDASGSEDANTWYKVTSQWQEDLLTGEARNTEVRFYDTRYNRMLATLRPSTTPGTSPTYLWGHAEGRATFHLFADYNDPFTGNPETITDTYEVYDGEQPGEPRTYQVTKYLPTYGRDIKPYSSRIITGQVDTFGVTEAGQTLADSIEEYLYHSGGIRRPMGHHYGHHRFALGLETMNPSISHLLPWSYSEVRVGPPHAEEPDGSHDLADKYSNWRSFAASGSTIPPPNSSSFGSSPTFVEYLGYTTDFDINSSPRPSFRIEVDSTDGIHTNVTRRYARNQAGAFAGSDHLQLLSQTTAHFAAPNALVPDYIEISTFPPYLDPLSVPPPEQTVRLHMEHDPVHGLVKRTWLEEVATQTVYAHSPVITYDMFGRIETMTSPSDGLNEATTQLVHQTLNELTDISSHIESITGSYTDSRKVHSYDSAGRLESTTSDIDGQLPSEISYRYDEFGYLHQTISQLKVLAGNPPIATDQQTLGVEFGFDRYGASETWKVGMGSGASDPPTGSYIDYEKKTYPAGRADDLVKVVKDREQLDDPSEMPALDTVIEPHGIGTTEAIRQRDGTIVDMDPFPQPYSLSDPDAIDLTGDIVYGEKFVWQTVTRYLDAQGTLVEQARTLLELTKFGSLLTRAMEGVGGRVEFYYYHDDARIAASGGVSNYQSPSTDNAYTTPINPLEAEVTFAKAPWLASGQSVKVGTTHYEYDYPGEEDGRLHNEVTRSALYPTDGNANNLDQKRIYYASATGRVSRILFEMNNAGTSASKDYLIREIRYTYDVRGKVILREHRVAPAGTAIHTGAPDYTPVPLSGLPVFRELMEYDGAGRLEKMTYAEPDTFSPSVNLPWRIYTYKYGTDGLLDSITQWGGSAVHWDTAPNPARAVVAEAHSFLGLADDPNRPGVFRKFKYDSFGRLLKEDRYYVIDEGTINNDPLVAEKQIHRKWEYTFSLDGVLLAWTETQAWPVATGLPGSWNVPSGQPLALSRSFGVDSAAFNRIIDNHYIYDTLGAATQIRDTATKFTHSASQDFVESRWDRISELMDYSTRERGYDPLGRIVAEETVLHDATGPKGNVTWLDQVQNRSLFQYQGWNLAAEYDVAITGADPARNLRWRYYHEGGLDSIIGGSTGIGSNAKNYYTFTDHLGSVVALMQVVEKEFYPDPEPPGGGGENMVAGGGEEEGGGESFMGGGGPPEPTLRWSLVPVEVMEYTPYGLPTIHASDNQVTGGSFGRLVSTGDGAQIAGTTLFTTNSTALEPRFGPTPLSGQNPFTCQSSFGWRILFAGREWDPGNRTYWNRQRVYAPEEGRFLSRDPMGYEDGLDQYAYCAGNPVNFLDKMGGSMNWFGDDEPQAELGARTLELIAQQRVIDYRLPPECEEDFMSLFWDGFQNDLDYAGMIPYVGEAFDGINAGIYMARGDYAMAALSAAAMIPLAGNAVTAAKLGAKGLEGAKGLRRTADACNSFPAGTLVLTPKGMMPIDEVWNGDAVVARDPDSADPLSEFCVVGLMAHEARELVELELETGNKIASTLEHPFWVEGSGWIDAGYLRPGMELLTSEGTTVAIADVKRICNPQMVYNLSVQSVEVFYVGEDEVLVHNLPKCNFEGIYEFVDAATQKVYVGSSNDVWGRLGRHQNANRIGSKVLVTYVPGGWIARRVAEQRRINQLGGKGRLANKINAIDPIFWKLFGV